MTQYRKFKYALLGAGMSLLMVFNTASQAVELKHWPQEQGQQLSRSWALCVAGMVIWLPPCP